MPEDVFRALEGVDPQAVRLAANPQNALLDFAGGQVVEFRHDLHHSGEEKVILFRVVNAYPAARQQLTAPHIATRRHFVTVAACALVSYTDRVEQWIVKESVLHQVLSRLLNECIFS